MNSDNISVNLLEKRGNLKDFSDEQKEDFVNSCKSLFVFYDPYKDLLVNPISSKTYYPKTIQRAFLHSKMTFYGLITGTSSTSLPSNEKIEETIKNLHSRERLAYVLQSVIRSLKFFGLITVGVLGYYIDYRLGLSIGLYLIYFDFNTFDSVNGLIDKMESLFMTSMIWQQNRNLYFFGSFFLLIISFVFLYLFTQSIWLTVAIFIFQKWLLVNPIIQFITSSFFRGNKLTNQLKEEYTKQRKNSSFLDENSTGIKINEINFDNEIYYGCYEQYKIGYKTVNNDYCSVSLSIYSKKREALLKENQDLLDSLPCDDNFNIKPLMNDIQLGVLFPQEKLLTKLKWLENNPLAEFYFENISNDPAFSYFLITKDELALDEDTFEGSFSENIQNIFHENGQQAEIIEYKNGIRHGNNKSYHKNGELEFECSFENGFMIAGNIFLRHDNGVNNITGAFRKIDGRNLEQKELYDHNSEFRIGVWKRFDKNGNLLKSVDYKENGEKETLYEGKANVPTNIF